MYCDTFDASLVGRRQYPSSSVRNPCNIFDLQTRLNVVGDSSMVKTIKLTETQLRLLKDLDDEKFEFSEGKLFRSYAILEQQGLVIGELRLFKQTFGGRGNSQFKRAFRRSSNGSKYLEGLKDG